MEYHHKLKDSLQAKYELNTTGILKTPQTFEDIHF